MAKTIVKAKAKQNESNSNILRRFSRRVRDAGIVNKARSLRFHTRNRSGNVEKKDALRKIERREEVEKLIKLGKVRDTRRKKMEINTPKEDGGKK